MSLHSTDIDDGDDKSHSGSAAAGDDLALPLECPECRVAGKIRWTSLGRRVRCQNCGCTFHIARNGGVHSDREKPHLRVVCQRCRKVHSVPTDPAPVRIHCEQCSLMIEIANPTSPVRSASQPTRAHRKSGNPIVMESLRSWLWAVGALVLLVTAMIGWQVVQHRRVNGLTAETKKMLFAMLQDSAAAKSYVKAGTEFDFQQYSSLDFRNAIGRGSMQGNGKLEVRVTESAYPKYWVEVVLDGVGDKPGTFAQCWEQTDNKQWQLDATETVKRSRQQQTSRMKRLEARKRG